LIGRERETAILDEQRRSAADGHGSFLLVSGEAGVGKSRLLSHFQASITATRSVCVLTRCVEFVQTPLSPLHDLLSQLAVRASAQDVAATAHIVDQLEFARSAERPNPDVPVEALFNAIDDVFARHALRRTVVLLIEDLQWADRSTIAFLSYLADRVARRRSLVVATYRSEEINASHPRLAEVASLLRKSSVTALEVAPFDDRSSRELIGSLLPREDALSASVTANIVRRSQGNAFFLEELLKAALAHGAGDAQKLPLSIRAAVLARAAMLSPSEREILTTAAVLGERFSVERLLRLRDEGREETLKALEHARALQIIYDRPDDAGTVAFRHALTQEALYGELLAERVRPLHERIAQELEERSDVATVSVELAHHWRRAGNRGRAAAYSVLAGDQAFAVGAPADAIMFYERAAADGIADSAVANLLHKTGLAYGALDQLGIGIERLREAGDRYWRAGDLKGFARNISALGAQLYNSGDPTAATRIVRDALDALETKLPPEELDLLRARLSYNSIAALDFDAALMLLTGIREPVADPLTASHVHLTRFKVAAMRGDIDLWRSETQLAMHAARQVPDKGSRLRFIQCQIALDALGLGELNITREQFRAAIPGDVKPGEPNKGLVAAASSLEHTLRGDFRTAARLLEESVREFNHGFAVLVHVRTAQLALGLSSGDQARLWRSDAEPLLHYAATHGMNLALGLLGGPYVWALGTRGDVDKAAAWAARIASVLPSPHRFLFAYLACAQFGSSDDVKSMRAQLAEAASRPGDRVNKAGLALFEAFAGRRGIIEADVQKCARHAAELFEGIGWPWLAALGYELANETDRALAVFRELGAVRDVRRVEQGRPDATAAILSPREREVADLAASGHSNDEIARALHLSLRTVEKHISSALRKLNLRSRVQLGLLLSRS